MTDVDQLERDAIDEAFKGQMANVFNVLIDNQVAGVPDAIDKFTRGRESIRDARRAALAQIQSSAT